MTIKEAVSKLQHEKQNNVTSRFPCRAILVKNISQYCQLLSELNKISGIRIIKSEEIFIDSDVLPNYLNLCNDSYSNEWTILTGVSEYLRMFPKYEASEKCFHDLWIKQFKAINCGRIIIPIWGFDRQWFETTTGILESRQEDYYFDCIDDNLPEPKMYIQVFSKLFDTYKPLLRKDNATLCNGVKELFESFENPSPSSTNFVLITKQNQYIADINGKINIHITNDLLTFICENMIGGRYLTQDNCSNDMQKSLINYALKGNSLDNALLKIFNVSTFSGIDVMGRWKTMPLNDRRFVALWYQIHSDKSYLNYCFSISKTVDEVPSSILHAIFNVWQDKPDWITEFKKLYVVMGLKPDAIYFKSLDTITDFEERLDFLSDATKDERIYILKMVGKWMRIDSNQVYNSHKLKEIYPALFAYLSCDLEKLHSDIGNYMVRYKTYKLENTLPSDEEVYFGGVDIDSFEKRYSVLQNYEDNDTKFLWIDALGVEWLSLLYWSINNNCDATISYVDLVQANLPTETIFNEQWKKIDDDTNKLNKLDKLAHNGVIDEPDYYSCIEEQIEFVSSVINFHVTSLLENYHRVVITGDHGTSRLAARFFHCRDGMPVPNSAKVFSFGRYCEIPKNKVISIPETIVKETDDKKYVIFRNYDHFKQSGRASGGPNDEDAYGEIHGGATPEEVIVPVIVVESNKPVFLTALWDKNIVKISKRKAELSITFSRKVNNLSVIVAGVNASVSKTDDGKKWKVVLFGLNVGVYNALVNADGYIVNMQEITLKAPLSGGDGDLP